MSSPKRILSSPTFLAASAVGTAALGVLGRKYFQGGVNTHAPDMSGKVILITGANTGIGRETARTIAGLGGLVVMACRSEERAREAMKDIEATHPEAQLEFLQLDLASFDSIRKAAAEFKAKHDKLHVLINNAGIMMCPEWRTKEGFEMQVGVNHIGHFLLTSLLLDSLKAAAPARIINVSSRSHYEGEIHWDDINYFKRKYSKLEAYGQSKLANLLFTQELHRRYAKDGISSFALHPGLVATELTRYLVGPLMKPLLLLSLKYFMKTSKQGAQTSLYCALAPGIESQSGLYFSDCAVKASPNPVANDPDNAKRLWEATEELIANPPGSVEKKEM